jgi:hypothetical protein
MLSKTRAFIRWRVLPVWHGRLRILDGMEYFFACPYCWEQISMVLDTSVKSQVYVEDCEVCCHPIEVRYSVEDDVVCDFEATALA